MPLVSMRRQHHPPNIYPISINDSNFVLVFFTVFLKDVSHTALKDLIQFMYCGEVNVKQEALPAFISTAEALQIKGLTDVSIAVRFTLHSFTTSFS